MTQNHKKIKKQLFHYIMDSLPLKRRGKVEAHLEECETCRREKESIENLLNGVKSKTGYSLPDYAFESAKTEMKREYRETVETRGKEPFLRPFIDKLGGRSSIRWIFQPAALMALTVLVSLIISGVSFLTQSNGLTAFNFPFSLFRAFGIS